MIDIYCKDMKCPICEKELITDEHKFKIKCQNKCYGAILYYPDVDKFFIFEKEFDVGWTEEFSDKDIINKQKKAIRDQIYYWKENDRYLMKIMEG